MAQPRRDNRARAAADRAAAERLVAKLKAFTTRELDSEERALFGALIAPGLSQALTGEEDVHGFGMASWSPGALPEGLVAGLRESNLRVVAVDDE